MSDKETAPWIKEAVAQIHSELDAATCDGHCETRKRALSKIIAAHRPVAAECTAPAPQPTHRTAEEKAAKLEELRQSYDCGNMGWSEAVGLYCAWRDKNDASEQASHSTGVSLDGGKTIHPKFKND